MDAIPALPSWLDPLLAPFGYLADGNRRLYWLYLLTAFAGAAGVYLLSGRGRRSLRGLIGYCFPPAVWRHRSTRLDLAYFLVHRASWSLLALPFLSAVTVWTSNDVRRIAGDWLGLPALPPGSATAAPLVAAVALTLAADVALFAVHWLMHRVPWLWEFHKVHHSAAVLTPVTAYRFHPLEDGLNGLALSLAGGGTYGLLSVLWPQGIAPAELLGAGAGTVLLFLAFHNLRHSHVPLRYPHRLSFLLVSPAMHQIHHSAEPRHRGRNLGFGLAIWDWMAGTLYLPAPGERFRLGLGGEEAAYDSLLRLYLLPFRRLLARSRRGDEGRSASPAAAAQKS